MDNQEKIIRKNKLRGKFSFEFYVANFILLLTFIAFGFIALMSIYQTCNFDTEPKRYRLEHIIFENDYILVNILVLVIFAIIAFSLGRLRNIFSKINMKFLYAGVFIYVVTLGLIWVFSVQHIPGADSANVFETATRVINDNFSSFRDGNKFYFSSFYKDISYFNFYPFQLGIVFISEIIYRIFGTESSIPFQIINVICLAFAYLCIMRITKLIFKRKSIEFISGVMLLGCLQPILLCTFAYGNIIGMSFSLFASYFLIKYLQTNKSLYIIPCCVLITIAVLAKYNNLIYVVAFAIILIVHTIREKKIKSIAFALVVCIVSVMVNNIVIYSYEKRAGIELKDGMSQVLYLNMGLSESFMAPGWYTPTSMYYYRDNNCNSEIANELAKVNINNRLEKFKDEPVYALSFFIKKVLSQWNEPTYECIWVSKTKSHIKEPTVLADSVYEGKLGEILIEYFNQYMQILFLLFAVGILAIIVDRKYLKIETIILPLALLGGFGYHLLFEAKSQYSTTYIILMIPIASMAIQKVFYDNRQIYRDFIKKLKPSVKKEVES